MRRVEKLCCAVFQSDFDSFPPLLLPVIGTERNRRSGRQHSVSTRRMVALYDYDPRESSPNVDVEVLISITNKCNCFVFSGSDMLLNIPLRSRTGLLSTLSNDLGMQ